MSIDDERDLYERLDLAVGTLTPREAPVDRAMRRGRGMRLRRRAAVAAGVAAVVAAGVVAVPSLRHAATERPAGARYTATVRPPGPHSPAGLIASGTVNGQRWQLLAGQPGAGGAGRGEQIFLASGPAFGPDSASNSTPTAYLKSADPVSFTGFSSGPSVVQYGEVRADVSSVQVRLGNGIVLTLHPATVWGVRMVAFAVPVSADVAEATVYSRHGEIASAIPFNFPGFGATFSRWLKPGEHGPGRASGRIASGSVSGRPWSVTAYLGPWGLCLETRISDQYAGGSCEAETFPMETTLLSTTQGSPRVASGTAAASVTRIVVHPSAGAPAWQVRPVRVGSQKFFAFALPAGKKATSWTAYDGSGHKVTSGTT